MLRLSKIGLLVKKIHREYGQKVLMALEDKGFTDLRPSFLDVLLFICQKEGPTIKEIGQNCGLKKQTMTGHLNELSQRGYILREINDRDKREQRIFLTDYGERFKFSLFEVISQTEALYDERFGELELERVAHVLEEFHTKLADCRAKEPTVSHPDLRFASWTPGKNANPPEM